MVGGRIVQLTGAAALTVAARMLALFQGSGTGLVAYITTGAVLPFPQDLRHAGVCLEDLLVVVPAISSRGGQRKGSGEAHGTRRVHGSRRIGGAEERALEILLRSRQCSCVCLDFCLAPQERDLSPGVMARISHLCRHTGTTVLLLPRVRHSGADPAVGVHLHVTPQERAAGQFSLDLDVRRSRIALRRGVYDAILPHRLY